MTKNNGRHWTNADDLRLRLAYGKAPARVIAKQLGRSVGAVNRRATSFENRSNPVRPTRSHYIRVLTEECLSAQISLIEALSESRRREVAVTRWRAWARLRASRYSLPGIGMVAKVDHTTVLHGVRRLASMTCEARG